MNDEHKKDILEHIENFNRIIILTHKTPDLDALGSQIGLLLSLKAKFPDKEIYASGECEKCSRYEKHLSSLDEKLYENSLIIVTDTGATELIYDRNYDKGSFLIKIDHHINNTPYGNICYVDESAASACQIIYMLTEYWGLPQTVDSAYALMEGLVADSGRFLYQSVNDETFYCASKLMETGLNLPKIYLDMYKEDLAYKRYKGYVLSSFIISDKIAYMRNYQEDVNRSNLSVFSVSRGMVNCMANLENVEIWVNFTEYNGAISAELRSSAVSINGVAKAFGGGGHKLASGATLSSWDEADKMLEMLKQLL